MWNLITKRNIVRSIGNCLVATHELLHLQQHQSSHGDHLVDGIGGTPWWCDLLSAGLLWSRRLDSWIGPISTYQNWSAQLQYVVYWVWPRLAVEGLVLGCSWMVRWYIHTALLLDGCHSADHILAIQWAFVSLGTVVDRRSFPLVAKGRGDFSIGRFCSLVMGWWKRWFWSMARGPVPNLLLAYEALLVGCLQVHGAALLLWVVSIQWLHEGCS